MISESIHFRELLIEALQVDLVGPSDLLGLHRETLPQAPSSCCLTGFLVPTYIDEDPRYDPKNIDDEVDQAPAVATVDKNQTREQVASKRSYLPSSLGPSVPVPSGSEELQVILRCGACLRIVRRRLLQRRF